MSIPSEYKGRFVYHFTHIDNIESIVKNGGLLSTNVKNARGISHHNVANENIQTRRSTMTVNAGPGGVVHDYVPFYFASTNKMLLGLLNRKNIDQPYVVFLVISIEKLMDSNVIFTNASANTIDPPNFYDNPEDLDQLNWELIDSTKWGEDSSADLHSRMAEVLVYNSVPLDWIIGYIVYNDIAKKEIERCYNEFGLKIPTIYYQPFYGRYFYFTKFFFKGRENETLVTGPQFLYESYNEVVSYIIKENRNRFIREKRFSDVASALKEIEKNFCVISELDGIYDLKTDNIVHSSTVSDHTVEVVNNLSSNKYFDRLTDNDKQIVKLAAYLHDIGKGPKGKWKDGIQKAYADHAADAIPMLARILTEEFTILSDEEVRKICLLVIYHDLLGDIIGINRSKQELLALNIDNNDLNMMAAISLADINAIRNIWGVDIEIKLDRLLAEVMR